MPSRRRNEQLAEAIRSGKTKFDCHSHFFFQQHCRYLDHAKESTNAKFNTPIDRQHGYGRYPHYSLSHALQTVGSNNTQRRGNVWWIARNGYLQTGGLQSKFFHRLLCPERFTVVMCPFKRATLNHKARYTVIPIWIISIVMCSPLLYVNQLLEYEGKFFCHEEWTPLLISEIYSPSRSYTVTHFALNYVLPLIFITVLYSCITSCSTLLGR